MGENCPKNGRDIFPLWTWTGMTGEAAKPFGGIPFFPSDTGSAVPEYIEFRDMLPKSKVGKYLRRELRSQERMLYDVIRCLIGGKVNLLERNKLCKVHNHGPISVFEVRVGVRQDSNPERILPEAG
jgi:hypothetical protein